MKQLPTSSIRSGTEHKDFTLPRDPRFFAWRNFFLRADHALKLISKLEWRPMRRRALEEAERWMLERIGEGSDGLAAVFPAMLNALIALRALGYSKQHPIYEKAAKDFAGLFVDDPEDFRIQPCLSPVWDTAINIIALAESGLPAEHPALKKAANWLVEKEVRLRGDWAVNNPHPEPSGWAFEYNNVYYPGHRRHRHGADGACAWCGRRSRTRWTNYSGALSPGN